MKVKFLGKRKLRLRNARKNNETDVNRGDSHHIMLIEMMESEMKNVWQQQSSVKEN
jgi:hypothetical protein